LLRKDKDIGSLANKPVSYINWSVLGLDSFFSIY